jgi:hypothetical protein
MVRTTLLQRCAYRALLVLATGCSHHGSRTGAVTPIAATAPVSWREYELANAGIYLRFPVEPTEGISVRRGSDDLHVPTVTSRSLAVAQPGHYFGCALTRADGVESSPPLAVLTKSMFKDVPLRAPAPALGDYHGERLVGTSPEGNSRTALVYLLAGGGLTVWVDSSRAASPALASQFFASLRFATRWEVRAVEPFGVAVAVPTLASEVSTPTRVEFTVAGNRPVTYTIAGAPLPPASSSSSPIDAVSAPEGHVISSTSVQHDGLPGKDWIVERDGRYARSRVLATASRLTFFFVVASSRDRIDDAEARRFLDSARIF